MLEDGLWAKEG